MEGVKIPVFVSTLYVIFYTISPYIGIPEGFIIAMYLFAPFVVLWLVLSILINGKDSGRKFSDGYWYDDMGPYEEKQPAPETEPVKV